MKDVKDSLDFLYKTDELKKLFGLYWIGPDKFEHCKRTLIVKMGSIQIYCTALPTEFFDIDINGIRLGFGSGCADDVHRIFDLLVSDIMIVESI